MEDATQKALALLTLPLSNAKHTVEFRKFETRGFISNYQKLKL